LKLRSNYLEDKIQIVNFLLTRRCNLQCSYCGIARNINNRLVKFYKNEVNTKRIIKFLENLKKHNPNAFVIWYGGEPLLRNDLSEIIKYCNNKHFVLKSNKRSNRNG